MGSRSHALTHDSYKRAWGWPAVALTSCLLASLTYSVPRDADPIAVRPPDPVVSLASRTVLEKLPLSFVANQGQTDSAVRFHVEGAGHTLFFTRDAVVFSARRRAGEDRSTGPAARSVVRLHFSGASPERWIEHLEPLPGTANFLLGNDPTAWHRNVPTYAGVRYRSLYPGIDLVFRGTQSALKSEFRLAPGADPAAILFSYSGAKAVRLRDDGALVVETRFGQLIDEAPETYQTTDEGRRVAIRGRYEILDGGRIRFMLGEYDRTRQLVIDPGIAYSGTFGGTGGFGGEKGNSIAVDGSGAVYICGETGAIDFPTTAGAFQENFVGTPLGTMEQNIFVSKINAAGSAFVYTTLVAGNPGEYVADGLAIRPGCASNCEVTFVGHAIADGYPVTIGAIQATYGGNYTTNGGDQVATRLNAAGDGLVWSTYLGGSETDRAFSVAVDAADNAYIGGSTNSPDFPVTGGSYSQTLMGSFDSTLTKVSPDGAQLYGTYFGGVSGEGIEGLAVHAGWVYTTGITSTGFPSTAGAFDVTLGGSRDAYLAILNPDPTGPSPDPGDLVYSTYIGGSDRDRGRAIAVDGSGVAHVVGFTRSSDFPVFPDPGAFQTAPVHPGLVDEAFVIKIDPAGGGSSDLVYSTFLGGVGEDDARGVEVGAGGTIYVTGDTFSPDWPSTDGAAQLLYGGGQDAFLSQLDPAGNGLGDLKYSTLLGGVLDDASHGMAVDAAGDVYLTGTTTSPDFPISLGSFSAVSPTDDQVFAAKLILSGPGGFVVGEGSGVMVASIDTIPPCDDAMGMGDHFGETNVVLTDGDGNVVAVVQTATHKLPPCPSESPPVESTESFPGAGFDVIEDTTAEVVVNIAGFTEVADLKGIVIIDRSDPDPVTREITTEMRRLVLTGTTTMGFPVRLRAGSDFGLPVSSGSIIPVDAAMADFPADASFNLNFEVMIPRISCVDPTVNVEPGTCTGSATPEELAFCLDPEGNDATLSASPSGPYALGAEAVTMTCDDAGELAESICHVRVVEAEPPVVTCPADTQILASSCTSFSYAGPVATATDNCDPNPFVSSSPDLPASFSGAGPHTIDWEATDSSGNGSASCQQAVTCTTCDSDPRSQGYWHRQCLGVPASEGGIDPGRSGRGPSQPLEPDFQSVLMPAVDLLLQNVLFEFGGTCQGGMDAVPANDKCEKATKQYTALLLNLESEKIQSSCGVELSAEGCVSTDAGSLVDELAGLINSNDPGNCQRAADCAAAVNEGISVVEGSMVAHEPAGPPPTRRGGSSHAEGTAIGTVDAGEAAAKTIRPSTSPSPPRVVLGRPSDVNAADAAGPDVEDTEVGSPAATEEDGLRAIHQHLVVLANADAPERAREVSTDALLTALSGGYEPELRLAIVQGLLGRVDLAYESLLADHLVNIHAEAEASGLDDLADTATSLLRQLQPSED